MKFGLATTRYLLSSLDNPHRSFVSVHIAGTNGKGSTAAMIASVLTATGYKVGLYTSPHLIRLTERIRINGREISDEDIADYVARLRPHIERRSATFFEATTAVALRYFADQKVDVAIVESGLGGRLDSTNVLTPLVSVITSIGLDHTELLGNTISSIAREKGGIIKPGVPCFVGRVESSAQRVLEKIALSKEAPIRFVQDDTSTATQSQSVWGSTVDVNSNHFSLHNLECSLPGDFQMGNIALSLQVLDTLQKTNFASIRERTIREGLANVRKYTGVRCRCEVLSTRPLIIADVAHNPAAISSLVKTLNLLGLRRTVTVFGIMRDKDLGAMVSELVRLQSEFVAVAPKTERALEPEKIVEMFHRRGERCVRAGDIRVGVRLAFQRAGSDRAIIVTGSHYVVGEFLQEFGDIIT